MQVTGLKDLFSTKFGYTTDSFQIPNDKTTTALNSKVAEFVHRYNSPDNLQIIYYAGHGFPGEEDDDDFGEQQLSLAPRYQGDSEIGDPQALFSDFIRLLRATQSDVLLIVDCCFASRTFSSHDLGRRKFELMASSMSLSPSPGKPGSFTTNLTRVIRKLMRDKKHSEGFPTSILYRHLFHQPELKEFKPLLFDQSQFDYGKIWLRPQTPTSEDIPLATKSDVALDLKLHLRLTRQDEIGLAMNTLAKQLQYLPHVDHIDFKALHAGDADVELFIQVLKKATIVKKVIRLLKERVQKSRQRDLEHQQSEDRSIGVTRSSSYYKVLNKLERSSTQTWFFYLPQFSNGKKIPSSVADVLRRSHSAVVHHVHQRSRAFRVPGILSISYVFDFTGLWDSTARFFTRWRNHRQSPMNIESVNDRSNGHLETRFSGEIGSGCRPKRGGNDLHHNAHKVATRTFCPFFSYERMFFLIAFMALWIGKDGW